MMRLTVPLHNVADLESGFGFPREYQGEGTEEFPFFRVSDMNLAGNEVWMWEHSNTVSKRTLRVLKARVFPVGTVIFPKIGAAIATEKKRILTRPATYDNNVMGAVPKAVVHPKFLYYWFLKVSLSDFANSAHVPSIRKSVMQQIPFDLPAPSEQVRIVDLLDEASRLRKLCREADAKAARILPALFLNMFGDPTTNPKQWKTGSLKDFGIKVRYGLGQPPTTSPTGLPLIRATNIDAGRITKKNMIFVDPASVPSGRNAFLDSNEVLVVRSGAYTGDVSQVTDEWAGAVAGYDLVLTPPPGWTGEFVEQFLLMPMIQLGYFASLKTRAGQPHLNSAQVESTPVFEPDENVQHDFSRHVQSFRQLRAKCEQTKKHLESLSSLLLNHAFSGQLTAKWRVAHMQQLLAEMHEQAQTLNLPLPESSDATP